MASTVDKPVISKLAAPLPKRGGESVEQKKKKM